jgi:hypothetical protein
MMTMAEEKNIKSEASKTTKPIRDKTAKSTSSFSKLSAFSLVASAVALGVAGYVFVNSENEAKNILNANQTYSAIQSELYKLKADQSQQKGVLSDVSTQVDAQKEGVKAVQAQLDALNAQIATPTQDMYLQMSVANIQSAIDYLILAKDVALFSGDTAKAEDLADTAFDRVEASRVANIGSAKRQDIKKALEGFVSHNDIVKEFVNIQQQFSGLNYLTLENFDTPKTNENKYWKYLSSVVEIQDISKDQQLVATKLSKQFIADNLYGSLMDLQTAMYMNNDKAIAQAKASLLKILNQYFIQNYQAKALEKNLEAIEPQSTVNLSNSLDSIISDLTNQQNALLVRDQKNIYTKISDINTSDTKEQISDEQEVATSNEPSQKVSEEGE